MAIEVNLNSPENPKENTEINTVSVTNPKESIEINIVHTNIQRDYSDFVNGLANELGISNREAFYSRIEGLIQTGSKTALDLDKFRDNFLGIISQYAELKKHHAVVPTETSSTDSVIVHNTAGEASAFRPDFIRKEGTEVTTTNPGSNNKNEINVSDDIEAIEFAQRIVENAQRTKATQVLELYLYNLIPYALGDLASLALSPNALKDSNEQDPLSIIHGGTSAAISGLNALFRIKYYSAAEMGKFMGLLAFYTLPFLRGRTIKEVSQWATGPEFSVSNIRRYQVPRRTKAGEKWSLNKFVNTFDDYILLPGEEGEALKERGKQVIIKGGVSPVQLEYNQETVTVSVLERSMSGEKWDNLVGKFEEYFHSIGAGPEELKKRSSLERDSVVTREGRGVLAGTQILFKIPERPDRETGQWKSMKSWLKEYVKEQNIPVGSEEVFRKVENVKYTDLTESIKYRRTRSTDDEELKDALNKKTGKNQIGAIYVWPIDTSAGEVFWIPFELNPTITESPRTARYQAMQVLSRMGDLQAYTGTDSLTVSLSTMYYPLAENPEDFSTYGGQHLNGIDAWMTSFSLKDIQLIELAYRSLTKPFFKPSSDTTEKEGYKYSRPPLLKVIIGDVDAIRANGSLSTNDNTPYSNLLTYPKELLPKHVLLSDQATGNIADRRYFRTFVATGVGITKDLQNSALYLNREADTPYLVDTFGFQVSMSLIEVTPNYMDVLPTYKEYYDAFSHNKTVFELGRTGNRNT